MPGRELLEQPLEPVSLSVVEASQEWPDQKDPVKRMSALDSATGAGQKE